jgi:hypothetical protein
MSQARKIRCGGEDRNVTVTVASQTRYATLTVPELLDEIKKCISGVGFSRNQTNREIRDRLLPALLELKKKTYRRKPSFYESLAAIGLNPDTVRQWFHRSHAAGEIAELIEHETRDEDKADEPDGDESETKLPGRDHKSPQDLLLLHCDRMAAAILEGKVVYAKRLATEYRRIRGDRDESTGSGIGGIAIEDLL